MLSSKIEIFFGKFAIYIIGFFILLSSFLGAALYVAAYKLDACTSRGKLVETQLEVSNASYASIRDEYASLKRTLEDNQKTILTNQAIIKTGVADAVSRDKAAVALEAELKTRLPVTDCKTPEDLKNAWKKL